jgi:hypothetical protein
MKRRGEEEEEEEEEGRGGEGRRMDYSVLCFVL